MSQSFVALCCSPPPKGSAVYNKVVAVARVCELHGKFTQARALFEAAGAYNELLALCVFQADFSGLQSYARSGGRDVEGLADQLLAINENAFRRVSGSGRALYGGRANVDDWNVTESGGSPCSKGGLVPSDGAVADQTGSPRSAHSIAITPEPEGDGEGMRWPGIDIEMDVAPSGRLPFMEASLRVSIAAAAAGAPPPPERHLHQEGDDEGGSGEGLSPDGQDSDGQPVARLDLTCLEAFLGVAGATVTSHGVSAVTASAHNQPLPSLGRTETEETSADLVIEATPGGRSVPDSSEGDAEAIAGKKAGGDDAQTAARAAFQQRDIGSGTQDDEDFFSSDEDSNPAEAETPSAASFATLTSNRFMFDIRSPEDTPRGGGGADNSSLRAAALSLKLGGIRPPGGGPRPSPEASTASGAGFGQTLATVRVIQHRSPVLYGRTHPKYFLHWHCHWSTYTPI